MALALEDAELTLGELLNELRLIIKDHAAVEDFLTGWVNEAVLQIATDFDLPTLRRVNPASLTVTTTNWVYSLPNDYHKRLFKVMNQAGQPVHILPDISYLDAMDYNHAQTGDNVRYVAVSGRNLGIYPKANETLSLWYYRLPDVLDDADDQITAIPPEFHRRLLLPLVVLMNFESLQDMAIEAPIQSFGFWQAKYQQGLYGSPRGPMGFVHWLAREHGTRPQFRLRGDSL